MDDSVAQFYDDLADDYHLLFADWKASRAWQAEVLDRIIREHLGPGPRSVLDCSCGIGTQAIGLAARGFAVHAADISAAAVARAEREAAAAGVSLTTSVADIRTLDRQVPGEFDIVLSCDNALPHLSNPADLLLATRSMWSKTAPDGLLLASIRDYDRLLAERPRSELPRIFDDPNGRRIVFQVWDWGDDRTYTLNLFIVSQLAEGWQTVHRATGYRALLREELSAVLREAGFSEVRWLMPDESGYYQPIVTARKRQDPRSGDRLL
jgi:glycine/sarcosine N-methyltransferase